MKIDDFYERTEMIHEVVEAKRSEICYNLVIDLITREINRRRRKKILDIGCGDGSFIVRFKKYCEVFGVDISSRAIKIAKEAGVDAYKVNVSCEKLPFEGEYFDVVYMGDVIEHLINPDLAVNEATRVIKSNGFLVLSTPNLACWLNRLLLLLGMQPLFSEVSTVRNFGRFGRPGSFPVGHLRLFTYEVLKEFLTYYRFKIVNVVGAPCEGLPKVLSKMDRIFSKIPSLSSIVIVVARKNE
ncbi:MAG: class I SAM-dependent methyltransferase [Candidatus Bathyarchaeota archaeon]|nr:class I SAM-dependent methyltransferase [Candidatus Bathyarchaeota archaeon]